MLFLWAVKISKYSDRFNLDGESSVAWLSIRACRGDDSSPVETTVLPRSVAFRTFGLEEYAGVNGSLKLLLVPFRMPTGLKRPPSSVVHESGALSFRSGFKFSFCDEIFEGETDRPSKKSFEP